MAAPVATEVPTRQRIPGVPRSKIRADIQALRALAVLLVIIGHFWPGRLPGGYVGVDVFFVISGFLITTHIFGEMERTGKLSFSRFYVRRAKRLLPAAILVSVTSLVAVVFTMPASAWRNAAEEVFAATVYIENWVLAWKSVDYSAQSETASTVQHYWSLSVEEQFYLAWPLLLLILLLIAARLGRSRRIIWAIGITLISLGTFVYAIFETADHRSQAYFVTPTRVWEFGAGAMIAVLALSARTGEHRLPRWAATTLQLLGLALITYSGLAFGNETPFPGPFALIPVLGAAIIITVGTLSPSHTAPLMFRSRLIQILGDISYSLYLWHWPLIIIAPYVLHHVPNMLERIALVVLSIILAYLTKKLVEDPGRTRLLSGASGRKVLLVFTSSIVTVGLICGAAIVGAGLVEARQAQELKQFEASKCFGAQSLNPANECADRFGPARVVNAGKDQAPWFDVPQCSIAPDPIIVGDLKLLSVCDFSDGNPNAPLVWLIGDSHAEQWKANVYSLAKKFGWRLKESLLGGCPLADAKRIAFNGQPSTDPEVQKRCLDWSAKVTERVVADKPDLVLTSTFTSGEIIDNGSDESQLDQYVSTLGPRIKKWSEAAGSVVVIRDTPLTLGHSTPECLARNNGQKPLECANPRDQAIVPDPAAQTAQVVGAQVIDLTDQFCDASTCYAVIGGLTVYFDQDHVSRSYVHSMLPVFEDRLTAATGLDSLAELTHKR